MTFGPVSMATSASTVDGRVECINLDKNENGVWVGCGFDSWNFNMIVIFRICKLDDKMGKRFNFVKSQTWKKIKNKVKGWTSN